MVVIRINNKIKNELDRLRGNMSYREYIEVMLFDKAKPLTNNIENVLANHEKRIFELESIAGDRGY